MTISTLRSVIDTAAIQTITGDKEGSALSNNTFSKLMSDVLSNNATTSDVTNYLGAIPSIVNAFDSQSSTASALLGEISSGSAATYMPPQLYSLLAAQSKNSNDTATVTPPTSTPQSIMFEGSLQGANQYNDIIQKAAATYNVDAKLIASIMKQESNFNASAKSYAGATGLMQLMPATAKYLGVTNSLDPEQNIMAGAKYISQMLKQFNGNVETALAAYNAGPGNVKKYGGIPPFKETQNYVAKVTNYYRS